MISYLARYQGFYNPSSGQSFWHHLNAVVLLKRYSEDSPNTTGLEFVASHFKYTKPAIFTASSGFKNRPPLLDTHLGYEKYQSGVVGLSSSPPLYALMDS